MEGVLRLAPELWLTCCRSGVLPIRVMRATLTSCLRTSQKPATRNDLGKIEMLSDLPLIRTNLRLLFELSGACFGSLTGKLWLKLIEDSYERHRLCTQVDWRLGDIRAANWPSF